MKQLSVLLAGVSVAVGLAGASLAETRNDGREGPVTFSGAALDQALADLSGFIRDRNDADAQYAALYEPAPTDFQGTAVALTAGMVGQTTLGGFDASIQDGRSLDLHLAAFNADLADRAEPVFLTIARDAAVGSIDMAAAGIARHSDTAAFGPAISSGETLEASLVALSDTMLERQRRDLQLAVSAGAVTGSSFDRYATTLQLY